MHDDPQTCFKHRYCPPEVPNPGTKEKLSKHKTRHNSLTSQRHKNCSPTPRKMDVWRKPHAMALNLACCQGSHFSPHNEMRWIPGIDGVVPFFPFPPNAIKLRRIAKSTWGFSKVSGRKTLRGWDVLLCVFMFPCFALVCQTNLQYRRWLDVLAEAGNSYKAFVSAQDLFNSHAADQSNLYACLL